ncbi:MAG: NAD(P)-binding domain-containing protein [Draconibacterium sp.]|nr:NAD(P)-binding domain-containing protein [Draconibacterium sp.]
MVQLFLLLMTSAMDLPLVGKIKLYETSKKELLDLWLTVLEKNKIEIYENKKVEKIISKKGEFEVVIKNGATYSTQKVLLAIGRRGSPSKLGIEGEDLQKVAYRLLEPELIKNSKIVVVGGGDSAIESTLLLMVENEVTLSYRKESFSRLKPKNNIKIKEAISKQKINIVLNSNVISIEEKTVHIKIEESNQNLILDNDLVYIFAGGKLPTQFLKNSGIMITQKFGEALLKHHK